MMRKNIVFLVGVAVLLFSINHNIAVACVAPSPDTDYGDAPFGFIGYDFPTLSADNGAYHKKSSLYLGSNVTWEWDGQPSMDAASDIGDDGVLFLSPLLVGETAYITVNANGSGYLNSWLDFNMDGDWSDPGEQIFSDNWIVSGENALTFEMPLSDYFGWTYARFRFSTESGLSYSGAAVDGEVEDYRVEISHAPVPNAMILLGVGMIGLAGIGRKKLK